MAAAKGLEPDNCFYILQPTQVIGINEPDLEKYPIPDVAVEIGLSTDSLDKFPIYAAFGVPEVWICNGKDVRFYQLAKGFYNQIETSSAFKHLSAQVLTEFLRHGKREGQTAALREFRKWLQTLNRDLGGQN